MPDIKPRDEVPDGGVSCQARRPLRMLVIGAGPTAMLAHLPPLARFRDRGDIVLAVVCDIQHERATAARAKFGFLECSGDAVAALERSDIDAVYIFGSAQLHFEYGVAALRGGKHLFVEKPIAPSYAQAQEMSQAARERGVVAAGGLNRRFYRSLAAVRARAGKAGWRFAEAIFHKPECRRPPPFGARSWLSANGIHALDALVYMMGGLPEHVTALTGERGAPEPSAFSAIMRWHDGGQGVFLCNNNAGARREEYVFHGLGETCTVNEAGVTVEGGKAVVTTPYPMTGDGFEAEHEAFLEAIRGAVEPPHSLAAIAPSLFLAELIEQGFSGSVQLPATAPQVAALRSQRIGGSTGKTVLVAQSAVMHPQLMPWLTGYRLISPEDVRDSPSPRPDVVAAILGRDSGPLPADILAKLPRLGIVGIAALSLARYDPDALVRRGIALVNASAAYADSVAEFALGLAILGRRRAFLSHEAMRAGNWGTGAGTRGVRGVIAQLARAIRPAVRAAGLEPFFLRIWQATTPQAAARAAGPSHARVLAGATIGLLGWGANARAFAERLGHAQARVLVYSERATPEDIVNSGAVPVSLGEALASDIVSLHRSLNDSTRHFLGAAELARLRPGAILINVARGALIEPTALLARLRQGDVFACLDTFEQEPLSASHPLRRLRNVFLTSHIAGGSPDMHAAAVAEVARKVVAFLESAVVDPIPAERLHTMT